MTMKSTPFIIDQSHAGIVDFSKNFGGKNTMVERLSSSENISIHILPDKDSIEVFLDDGLSVIRETFFIEQSFDLLELDSSNDSFIF